MVRCSRCQRLFKFKKYSPAWNRMINIQRRSSVRMDGADTSVFHYCDECWEKESKERN